MTTFNQDDYEHYRINIFPDPADVRYPTQPMYGFVLPRHYLADVRHSAVGTPTDAYMHILYQQSGCTIDKCDGLCVRRI